ncbi:uncharacterized protein HMPREF1541_00430 [Cyphellophora europaea CBS 101466]|uniref:Lysophospholipase n=1 Tax=Cyphellophora europaea (strain CBS 101466) TaxID=1220924 RepID=W2SBY9_CYPE1|nr:uncharacterized protein HMPREF1541_00430 [Cyphellophora europaea CBS 101466]ETN46246.1 hypothetical protein HMPREF1541_00430 [Cyphellophora europaea CBS 101466]
MSTLSKDPTFGPPRRSETLAQQQYEQQILNQHYTAQQLRLDEQELQRADHQDSTTTTSSSSFSSTSGANGTDGDHKAKPSTSKNKAKEKKNKKHFPHLPGQFPASSLHSSNGAKRKLKSFWNRTVVPAFPEAVGDISLIKKAWRVEAGVARDMQDARRYPELGRVAQVRRGLELCGEEKEWFVARRDRVKGAFCRFVGLDEREVEVQDVPIVGFGGSGGGYRAMIGVLGYAKRMKESGLWDLLSYVAGVSGSCWSLAAYYTWAKGDMERVVQHCKKRLNPYHPLSPEAIREVLHSPGGPALTLGPLVQKHRSGLETVAMDLYSVFTTGYLFLGGDPAIDPTKVGHEPEKEIAGSHPTWLTWSSAIQHLEQGQEPLPLLTAIRHERPWKDWADDTHPFKNADPSDQEHSEAVDAWFQWFEMSPFEIGCDELGAWCPTWAFGRPFDKGKSTMQLPEQSLALLLGLCTSAPAGPLTSYLATIKRNLPPGFLGSSILDLSRGVARFWGKQGTEEFQQRHPLHACNEHNFMLNLSKDSAGEEEAAPIEKTSHIHLIDSGMDNNCPTYVLLHPSRDVDVILNMDASSDVQKDTFQERVDQIGSRRSLKFTKRNPDLKPLEDEGNLDRFQGLYGQIYDGSVLDTRPETVMDSYGHEVSNPPAPAANRECSMVYLPLLPNEAAVPEFDPSTAKFSGSYNLVWTSDQVDMLMKVSEANCAAAEASIKTVLLEAYERNKARRLRR